MTGCALNNNLARAQAAYTAFALGDRNPFIELIGPNCRIDYFGDPTWLPWAGSYTGPEGFAEMLGRIGEALAIGEYRANEFLPSGDALVVLGIGRGTARNTSRPFEAHWAHYIHFDGERAIEFRIYNDTFALATAVRV